MPASLIYAEVKTVALYGACLCPIWADVLKEGRFLHETAEFLGSSSCVQYPVYHCRRAGLWAFPSVLPAFPRRRAEEEMDGGFWLTAGAGFKGVSVMEPLVVYLEVTMASPCG